MRFSTLTNVYNAYENTIRSMSLLISDLLVGIGEEMAVLVWDPNSGQLVYGAFTNSMFYSMCALPFCKSVY